MSSPSEAPGLPQPAEPTGDADFKLRAARYWITVQRPYYARALFACRLLTTGEVETMSIDMQWRIYANPDYLETLSVPETAGLIIHNLNHRLRQHAERSRALSVEARLGNVWHAACDCEIDDDLASDGLTLPEDLLFPYMFDMPNGRTAEQYRQGLIDGGHVREATLMITETGLAETSLPSGGSGVTGAAESYELSSEDLSDIEQQLLRHATAEAIRRHAAAEGRGSVPAGLQRWADEQLEPKVDWRKTLASAIRRALHQRAGAANYSWRRPPRRHDPNDSIQRPGAVQPYPSLAVVVDTSGSMSDTELSQARAEIRSILTRIVPGYAIRVLCVDADVASDTRVTAARKIRLAGGGGTDMRVGIETAAATRPAAIIVITDGYTPWPETRTRGVQLVIAALVGDNPPIRDVPGWMRAIHVD